jgi:hypothetical protein
MRKAFGVVSLLALAILLALAVAHAQQPIQPARDGFPCVVPDTSFVGAWSFGPNGNLFCRLRPGSLREGFWTAVDPIPLLIQYASRLESESASARKRIAALEKDNADLKRRVKELEYRGPRFTHGETGFPSHWFTSISRYQLRPHHWASNAPEKDMEFGYYRTRIIHLPQVVRDCSPPTGCREVWTLDFCLLHGETRVLHSPDKKP